MRKLVLFIVIFLFMVSVSGEASASVTTYSSNTPIINGNIVTITSVFSDFPAGDYYFPGALFTRGGVTYTSTENVITGSNRAINNTGQSLILNNHYSPISGTISQTSPTLYDKFGFDIGQWGNSLISITLTTNMGSYSYNGLSIANAGDGNLQYLGYQASAGEHFTGFIIAADNGWGYAPEITNVTVATSVPEPGTYALMGIGGLLAAIRLRKSRLWPAFAV
jgi:hypothetical protein